MATDQMATADGELDLDEWLREQFPSAGLQADGIRELEVERREAVARAESAEREAQRLQVERRRLDASPQTGLVVGNEALGPGATVGVGVVLVAIGVGLGRL